MFYSLWTNPFEGLDIVKYDIYIDTVKFVESPRDKIYILCEPSGFMPERLIFLESYHNKFKLILTYDNIILKKFKNAQLLVFGTTWIPKELWNNNYQKENKISFWIGHKRFMYGHEIRQLIFSYIEKINNIDLYLSKHHLLHHLNKSYKMILGESKMPLFDKYKFHVCIENCRMDNYFTEKLIDCFLTKTIPIYWGCTNIDKYFNTKGMIILNINNIYEIIDIINNISFDMYDKYYDIINENHLKAQQYTDYNGSIIKAINNL